MKTIKNQPITVIGDEKSINDIAVDFKVIDNDLNEVHLSDFNSDFILLNVVPSLDTSVCDIQTRTINERLSVIPNLKVLTISNDLPFAQKRYCSNVNLNITTLSDHKYLDFALKYGLLIEELRLLARAVLVLDKNRKIIYKEYLDEMSNHPNYEALFEFLNQHINNFD